MSFGDFRCPTAKTEHATMKRKDHKTLHWVHRRSSSRGVSLFAGGKDGSFFCRNTSGGWIEKHMCDFNDLWAGLWCLWQGPCTDSQGGPKCCCTRADKNMKKAFLLHWFYMTEFERMSSFYLLRSKSCWIKSQHTVVGTNNPALAQAFLHPNRASLNQTILRV